LGGAFNSRINLNLRELKGWTYGARSSFSADDHAGDLTFSAGIKSAVTDSALSEVVRDFDTYANSGISKEEMTFMKNAYAQSMALKYETGFQKARFIGNILQHNLSPTFVDDQTKLLNTISSDDINGLAKKWFSTDRMHIVLAGDKDRIQPGLEKLGYTVVELDGNGEKK
jgi:zinc protease